MLCNVLTAVVNLQDLIVAMIGAGRQERRECRSQACTIVDDTCDLDYLGSVWQIMELLRNTSGKTWYIWAVQIA
jgi:hypothetical protein